MDRGAQTPGQEGEEPQPREAEEEAEVTGPVKITREELQGAEREKQELEQGAGPGPGLQGPAGP